MGQKTASKPRWSIWISPGPSIGRIIGFWRLFWRLSDSNRCSANWLAWCTTTRMPCWRWTGSTRRLFWSSGQFGRIAPCLLFSMSSLGNPCSVGFEMRGKSGPAQYSFCWPSFSEGLRIRRWYHSTFVSLLGQNLWRRWLPGTKQVAYKVDLSWG